MASQLIEGDFNIDDLCVEDFEEVVVIEENDDPVILQSNDSNRSEMGNVYLQPLTGSVSPQRNSIDRNKIVTSGSTKRGEIVDGNQRMSKKLKVASTNKKTNQSSKSEWKIADDLFEDETNSTASVVSESETTISDLPEEVLIEIMKRLTSTARKNAKLVCNHWYTLCSMVSEEEERIFISLHNESHLDDILSILMQSTRQCFNLEFCGLDFTAKPRTMFWKTCGPKVTWLKLSYCKLSSGPFANILKYCSNLQTLELYFGSIHFELKKLRILMPNKTLTEDIQNKSLKTLKFFVSMDNNYFINRLYVTYYVVRFFQLFPNLSNFSLSHRSLLEESWFKSRTQGGPWEESPHDRQARNVVPKYFVKSHVENVAINYFLCPGLEWNTVFTNAAAVTKISEISIELDHTTNVEAFKNFVQAQVNLRSVTYVAIKRIREAILVTFLDAVSRIQTLRELQILFRNVIHWNSSWTTSLSMSNIEALRIFCREINFSKVPINSQDVCTKLTSLAIQATKNYGSSIVPVLKTARNLKELYLSHMNDDVLETICLNQISLRSLHAQSITDSLDRLDLIHCLKELRRLEIPQTDYLLDVTSFGNLKHLHLLRSYLHESWDESSFLDCHSFSLKHLQTFSCPSLETVRLDCLVKPEYPGQLVNAVAEFVAGLKYLKFLSFCRFVGTTTLDINDLSAIFERCPTLEILILGEHAFFNDVIEKRIRRITKSTAWDMNFNEYELVGKYMNARIDRHQWDFFFHRCSAKLYQPDTF